MQLIKSLKNIFSIPMIIIYVFVYIFRFPIMIFILTLYANYSPYGKAFSHRLVGEFYFSESRHADILAQRHFDLSKTLYLETLNTTSDPTVKGQIETLIGSQYECGKGVRSDLGMAKEWYEKAITHGSPEARDALDNLEAHLTKHQGKATLGEQCIAPFEPPTAVSPKHNP